MRMNEALEQHDIKKHSLFNTSRDSKSNKNYIEEKF